MKVGVLLAGLLIALSPGTVVAEQFFAAAALYEVRETVNCNPGSFVNPLLDPLCAQEPTQGFGTRIAGATLVGTSQGAAEFTGLMTAEASSVLSQVDWTGPAHGKIKVTTGGGTTLAGFSGELDLSFIAAGTAPLAPIAGRWQGSKGTLRAGGRFEGLFLVPVPAGCSPPSGGVGGCFYFVPGVGFVPLAENEYATVPDFGTIPLVKLLVTFFTR